MAESDYLAISGLDGGTTITTYIPSASATETISGLFSNITYNLPTVDAGASVFSPLDVTLFESPATNQLLSAAAAQTVIPSVTLYIVTTGGNREVTLSNVTVAAAQVANGGYAFSFDYGSITTSSALLNQRGLPKPTTTTTVVTPPGTTFAADQPSASTDGHGASVYVHIPGAAGSITAPGYSEDLLAQGYTLNLSGALGQPLTIDFDDLSKIAGGGSLLDDAASGKVLPTLDLSLVLASPRVPLHTIEQIQLQNAIITKITPILDDDGNIVTDELTVTYTTASVTDESYDSTGSVLESNTTSFEEVALCYVRGTRILTDRGEIEIEKLVIGDRIVTEAGLHQRIKWIGWRCYDGRFIRGNNMALPICFAAGSLGDGVPLRDLWVSPGHSMLVEGHLVHAHLLVNGVSITQIESVESVTYFNIELDDHDIILAEGTFAESFHDNGCRNVFANAAEFHQLYPNDPGPGLPCYPFLTQGFQLEAIRGRINDRAGIGRSVPTEPCLLRGHLDIAGPATVCGWAQDERQPEVPVVLDVLVDGRRVMRILANRYRADLRAAGLGSGRHSFEVELPCDCRGTVAVRRTEDGVLLPLTDQARALAA